MDDADSITRGELMQVMNYLKDFYGERVGANVNGMIRDLNS